MLKFVLDIKKDQALKVLCLGAHSDDIEIGCGGTVLKLINQYKNAQVYWVVLSAKGKRKKEAADSAKAFLADAKSETIIIKGFKDGFFPYIGGEIKEYFEELKQAFCPDFIFTHYRNDLHQDHRLVSELTWNTFRDHLIFEYEIPKYDGDLGPPNLFIYLDEATCRKKVQHIFNIYKTQGENQWFSEETFQSILRIRGVESNSPTKYAEAFYCRKTVIV